MINDVISRSKNFKQIKSIFASFVIYDMYRSNCSLSACDIFTELERKKLVKFVYPGIDSSAFSTNSLEDRYMIAPRMKINYSDSTKIISYLFWHLHILPF